jgi:ammonium transporter, Amt family
MTGNLADAENGKTTEDGSLSLRPRILLAEDEPDHQRLISLMLHKVGADVTVVENGQSVVGLALQAQEEGYPFDLILMDIRMPVMDGYRATRHLREVGYKLPIVALTANAMREDYEKFLAAGGDDYVSKPLVMNQLIDLVKRLAKATQPKITR